MARELNGKNASREVVSVVSVSDILPDFDRDACDICGNPDAMIGCPNGKQICQHCFDAGYDGDHFYDDNDFHHFLGF